jgi:hypothetical protein
MHMRECLRLLLFIAIVYIIRKRKEIAYVTSQ